MLIGVEKRFIFVANSKTASTSIEAVLAPHAEIMRGGAPARKHIPLTEIREGYQFLFGQPEYPFDGFFRFGVMREPMEWIQSWYRYRKGNNVAAPLPDDMTFEEFWRQRDWNIAKADGTPFDQSVRFQDRGGQVLADVIIPHAEVSDYMDRILKALRIREKLPHRNASRITKLPDRVSPALEAEIREHYAKDYALYERLPRINAEGMARVEDRAYRR